MLFSVVIPTYNRIESLIKCLDLLLPAYQTISSNEYEVIVSDDSNLNTSELIVKDCYSFVKWVSGPKKGPAANRNNGARHSKGEWLVFIDDDCLPDKNILSVYKSAIDSCSTCLAFEGSILPDDWKLLSKSMAECPVNVQGNLFWSANICVNTNLFNQIKGFDEELMVAAHEDKLIFSLIKKHTTVPFLTEAIVIHPVRFNSVYKKIINTRKSLDNWLKFNNKIGLSFKASILEGVLYHIRDLKQNLFNFRINNCLINLYTLFIGLPNLILKHVAKKYR